MDPLALLPYALAAAGGRVGAHDVTALVAAGVTLLQRSAPLVRALAGRRSAVLLPPGAPWLVALAASDGRSMVLLDPLTVSEDAIAAMLRTHDVGAVFTSQAWLPAVPADIPFVLLDEAPSRARVCALGRDHMIDLGSHFALDLVGDTESPGSPEECLRLEPHGAVLTHADLLVAARRVLRDHQLTPLHHTTWASTPVSPESIVRELVAPLLVGGTVDTGART